MPTGVQCVPGGACVLGGHACWDWGHVCWGRVHAGMPGWGGGHACQGVCMPRGACVARMPSPLWTEFMTYACENIIFQQLLLRVVKIYQIVARQ